MNFVKFNLLLVCFLRSADVAFKSAEVWYFPKIAIYTIPLSTI
jgi:hypothetical protein